MPEDLRTRMKIGVQYAVTNSSDDLMIMVGEHVKLLEDGSLMCNEACGWIDKDSVAEALKGARLRVDTEVLHKLKARLIEKLDKIDQDLEDLTEICF